MLHALTCFMQRSGTNGGYSAADHLGRWSRAHGDWLRQRGPPSCHSHQPRSCFLLWFTSCKDAEPVTTTAWLSLHHATDQCLRTRGGRLRQQWSSGCHSHQATNCLGPAPRFGLPYAGERAGEQSQLRLHHRFPCITRLISTCCAFRAATHPMLLLTSCNGAGPAEAGCTSGNHLTATRIRRLVSIRMAFMLAPVMCSRPTLAGASV